MDDIYHQKVFSIIAYIDKKGATELNGEIEALERTIKRWTHPLAVLANTSDLAL